MLNMTLSSNHLLIRWMQAGGEVSVKLVRGNPDRALQPIAGQALGPDRSAQSFWMIPTAGADHAKTLITCAG